MKFKFWLLRLFRAVVWRLAALGRRSRLLVRVGKCPGVHAVLLRLAGDAPFWAGDKLTALEFAQCFADKYPDSPVGFVRGAQAFLSLGQLDEAQKMILAGLERHPNQLNLLTLATNLFVAVGRPDDSLHYARRLAEQHPDCWVGYVRSAQNLTALRRFDEAKKVLDEGLHAGVEPRSKLQSAFGTLLLTTREFSRAEDFFRMAGDSAETEMERAVAIKLAKCSGILRGEGGEADVSALPSGQLRDLKDAIVHGAFRKCSPENGRAGISSGADSCGEDGLPSQDFLFVMGLGRSGTTALGNMLNISAKIEIYTELYPPHAYSAADFGLEQVKRVLKNHPHEKANTAIMAKRPSSVMVGDKRPNLQFLLEPTFESLGGRPVTFIHVARDLRAVCLSAEKRAKDPSDRWPPDLGMEQMICLHNRTVQYYLELHERRPELLRHVVFVDHETVFGSIRGAEELFEKLGVSLAGEERCALEECIKEAQQVIASRSVKAPIALTECMDRLLDHDAHARFRTTFYSHA